MHTRSMRKGVTRRKDAVWSLRDDTDAYTLLAKSHVERANAEVDHILDVALVETSFDRCCGEDGAGPWRRSTEPHCGLWVAQCAEMLSEHLNANDNLNVTTRRVNQKKKGPMASALHRMRFDSLRSVSLEQFARSGAARELVDDGTWARIEALMAARAEALQSFAEGGDAWTDAQLIDVAMHPTARRLLCKTADSIVVTLSALGVE